MLFCSLQMEAVAADSKEEEEVEIDYDDLGDQTPPESVKADEMEFEIEGRG